MKKCFMLGISVSFLLMFSSSVFAARSMIIDCHDRLGCREIAIKNKKHIKYQGVNKSTPTIEIVGRRLTGNCSVYYYGFGGGFFGSGVTKLANEDRARGRNVVTSHWFAPVDVSACRSVKVAGHSMAGPTAVATANAAKAQGKTVELNVLDTTRWPRWQGVPVAAKGVHCNHYRQSFGLGGGHVGNCKTHNLTGRYGHVAVPYALSGARKTPNKPIIPAAVKLRQTGNAFNLTIVYVSADERYPTP